jgi:hypothetical protein
MNVSLLKSEARLRKHKLKVQYIGDSEDVDIVRRARVMASETRPIPIHCVDNHHLICQACVTLGDHQLQTVLRGRPSKKTLRSVFTGT